MAAVFEEKQLGFVFLGEIKADGAVAALEIARDAATGAHAVDLVNAEVSAHVKFAPGFDENGVASFLSEEKFQGGTFVIDVGDGRNAFERVIVQAG